VSKTKKVQPRFQEYSLGFVGSLPYFMTVYHSPSPTPPLYSAIFFACEACPYVRERRVCIVDCQFFLKCEASTQISLLLFRVFRRPTLIVDRVFRPPSSRFVSDLSLFGFCFPYDRICSLFYTLLSGLKLGHLQVCSILSDTTNPLLLLNTIQYMSLIQ